MVKRFTEWLEEAASFINVSPGVSRTVRPSFIGKFPADSGLSGNVFLGNAATRQFDFDLMGLDRSEVREIKRDMTQQLSPNEIVVRYRSHATSRGVGFEPLIKIRINRKSAVAFFLDQDSSDGKTDKITFDSEPHKLRYLNLDSEKSNQMIGEPPAVVTEAKKKESDKDDSAQKKSDDGEDIKLSGKKEKIEINPEE